MVCGFLQFYKVAKLNKGRENLSRRPCINLLPFEKFSLYHVSYRPIIIDNNSINLFVTGPINDVVPSFVHVPKVDVS